MKKANLIMVAVMVCFAFIVVGWIPVLAEPGKGQGNNKNLNSVNLPQTGWTYSYYPGDDGDLQMGVPWPVPRFKDNGDGTVTDNLTKLVWLKNAGCFGVEYWVDALNSCNNLKNGDCGLSDNFLPGDWRLPNRNELLSLVDISTLSQAKLPDGHPFTNVMETNYWSSSTATYNIPAGAYYMNTYDGTSGIEGKVYKLNGVWPVRSEKDDHHRHDGH